MIENQMANLLAGTGQTSHVPLPRTIQKSHAIRAYPLTIFDERSAGEEHSDTDELTLRIELGQAQISIDDSRSLRIGSVLSLDTLADDLANVYADGQLIGRGEVLTIDGKIGIRMVEIFG